MMLLFGRGKVSCGEVSFAGIDVSVRERAGQVLGHALGVGPGGKGLVPVQKPVDCDLNLHKAILSYG